MVRQLLLRGAMEHGHTEPGGQVKKWQEWETLAGVTAGFLIDFVWGKTAGKVTNGNHLITEHTASIVILSWLPSTQTMIM